MRRKEVISIWRSRWVCAPGLALAIRAWFPTPAAGTGANQDLPVVYRVAEQPRVQIGSVDDHTTGLFRVTHAIRLRDGRILIADGGAAELKFFDARGNHLRLTGREGDGPGEFRGLQRIAELDDGRIAALDILLRRVTVFSPEGELDHTRPVTEESDELGLREPLAYGVLADGTLVGTAEVEGAGVERRYGDYPSSVLTYRAPIVQPVLIDSLGVAAALGPPLAGSATVREMRSSTTGGRIHISGGGRLPSLRAYVAGGCAGRVGRIGSDRRVPRRHLGCGWDDTRRVRGSPTAADTRGRARGLGRRVGFPVFEPT